MQFRYCPRCTTELAQQKDCLLCASCGYKSYFNPKPCNAAILFDKNNRVLFLRRKFDPHKGKLDLPGGFMEYHESAEESMQRELQEEVGFTVENLAYLGSFPNVYHFQGEDLQIIDIVFKGKLPENVQIENITSNEATEIVLLSLDEIKIEDLAFKSIEKALEKVRSSK